MMSVVLDLVYIDSSSDTARIDSCLYSSLRLMPVLNDIFKDLWCLILQETSSLYWVRELGVRADGHREDTGGGQATGGIPESPLQVCHHQRHSGRVRWGVSGHPGARSV